VERRLAAILAADVVGYSRLMEADEEATARTLSTYREIIEGLVASYHGRVFGSAGDSVIAEFASPVEAVRCAVDIQRELGTHNVDLPEDRRMRLRIGVNLGDVMVEGDNLLGDGVNIAARLETLADPGGISLSRSVFDQVKKQLDLGYEYLGEHEVKNIAEPVHVYRVLTAPEAAGKVIGETKRATQPWKWAAVGAAVVVLIGVAGAVTWLRPWEPAVEPAAVERMAFPLPDKPSIAVLPFANMSADPEQEYFSDGMTEDIITGLSKFGLFFVISRNSTFAYKDGSADVKDVARDLGVQYVLEGSVRKSGNRVRITAQLVDAMADKHIWAESYDRELEDVFEVQDEIRQSIVTSVAPEYLSAEMQRAQRKEERNLDAWDAFMRSYWHFLRYTEDDNAAAQRLLRKAIDLDPQQANYHGLLAVTHVMDAFYGWSESGDASFRVALESAERALALDEQDTLALRSIGLVHFFSKNHDVALSYYERAVAVNPNEAVNRALLGAALGVAGNYDAALEQFEIAMRLSPRDVHISAWYSYLAVAAFVMGRDEEAAEWARKSVEANPQFPGGYRTLAASAGNLGQLTEAEAARARLQELLPHLTIAQLRESLPYFKNADDLERYLDGLREAGLPE
jgi:adenylate cyclase